jgi:peptidoglycan hydrolase CwlO-like protein
MKHISLRNSALVALTLILMPAATLAQGRPSALPSTAAAKAAVMTRLADAKLKACQNREAAITKRSTQLAKTASNIQEKFDAIATRVETYYTAKAVPAGKTISNYDALVAEIATKKTAVQTALTTVQTSAAAFSCTSDDPKRQLTQFRTDMQAVKKDLQGYRTAIKNLIVAIRSATGKTESSASPKASTSPTAGISPAVSTTPEVE